jgi:hypothetical protein
MFRLILFALIAATLAACSAAGPGGYGYAANDRPSLRQLGLRLGGDPDNPFRSAGPIEQAEAE